MQVSPQKKGQVVTPGRELKQCWGVGQKRETERLVANPSLWSMEVMRNCTACEGKLQANSSRCSFFSLHFLHTVDTKVKLKIVSRWQLHSINLSSEYNSCATILVTCPWSWTCINHIGLAIIGFLRDGSVEKWPLGIFLPFFVFIKPKCNDIGGKSK